MIETAFSPFTAALPFINNGQEEGEHVWSVSVFPIYETLIKSESVTGFTLMTVDWGNFFDNQLPPEVDNIRVAVKNTCGQSASYDIVNGQVSVQLGCLGWSGDASH